MFWATIDAACRNWPAAHSFQPTGVNDRDRVEHLYGWLLVQVDYVDIGFVASHEVEHVSTALGILRREVKSGKKLTYWELRPNEMGCELVTPRSTSEEVAGKRQFEDVRSQVYEVIEIALNTKVEDLKREAQRDAA